MRADVKPGKFCVIMPTTIQDLARVQLDRIGIIEMRPLNRYRLKLAKTFRWRPHGPVFDLHRILGLGENTALAGRCLRGQSQAWG